MTHLKEGNKAPDLKYKNKAEQEISLQDFQGQKVILYFYPKDNTSGCTAEACNLRDNYDQLIELGYKIIGVSPDSEKSHENFSKKYELPFDLIPDTEKKILNDYGVWGEKQMYGKTYMGVNRTTFIISEDGTIEKIISKVKTKDHTNQILEEMGQT
jgi:thioredoxin-dependent peroxiredoxin